MKLSNTVVSVIVITAVLLSVCAVGLLIRQARTGRSEREPQTVTEANDAASQPDMAASLREPGAGQARDDAEQRARLKKEREQVLEKMRSLTEEEQEQFRERIRQRFSSQRAESQRGNLSPEEREQMRQKWQNMSEEQRRAALARMRARSEVGRRPPQETAPEVSEEQGTDGEQGVGGVGSEPNGADEG